ncbi:MAG: PEP-CTERM sorting domain-containing protein [Terriglobales bacterium]
MHVWKFGFPLLGLVALAAGPLYASPITFNFGGSGEINSPATFTAGGLTITAYGYVGTVANNLFQKDSSASEDGLGLNATVNDEINANQSIIFDVSGLISKGITGGTFTLGSLQYHNASEVEGAAACVLASNSPVATPVSCAYDLEGNSQSIGSVTLNWGSNDFVEFITDPDQSDGAGNYLVNSLAVVTTPEPPTMILFGTMLLVLGVATRRRWAESAH